MSEEGEYRCFIGGLAWATKDTGLEDAFEKFGHLTDAKVAVDRFSGRSRGFGFVSFQEKEAMEEAIKAMNDTELDGRNITVEKAQPNQGGGRDRDGERPRDGDHGHDQDRGYGGGRGSGGGAGFKCGKPGHFARECPSEEGRGGGSYSGRDDRYGGGGSRHGLDRNGDRNGGRSRDSGGREEGDRYSRNRSGPYDRRSSGGYR